jgi:DNA polymerase-3 subunit alpha
MTEANNEEKKVYIEQDPEKTFVHLHCHTEYSLLDGAARVKDVVARAVELGMPAVAITDHGVMYGVLKLYDACKAAGINPVIGCEVYVAPRTRFDKESGIDNKANHLILLAETQEGYRNLCKICTIGFLEGYYYKPRIDHEVLRQYSKGIICMSACIAGEIPQALLKGDIEKAYEIAREYIDIFGKDNYFIEIQDHGLEEQKKTNPLLIKLAKDLGLGLVATNDSHYVKKEDADIHDVLLCIQTGKTRDDESRMRFACDEFYMKNRQEMELLFGEYPEALSNTVKIAARCHVNLDKHDKVDVPDFDVPEGYTPETYLSYLCQKGLAEKYDEITPELQERLDYELGIINHMQFPGYFLITWDMINFCRKNGIRVGPGRGSAAGSLVAYTLGITNIDPLRYNLFFERFLNPERVSMPDIDSDFCVVRRGEVIDYLVDKYGADNVSQIVTFGTLKAKMVVRDVGRVLGMSVADVNKIAKMIPDDLKMTVPKAIEENNELKALYETDPLIKELLDYSIALEGMPRHTGTHAAGVVIAPAPITDYVPGVKLGENILTTQFEKEQVEEQGLLKMDILGLRTLTVIGDTLKSIKDNYGIDIDIDNIPKDDADVYKMLSNGETSGVFQLESSGMTAYLKSLKPERIEDLIAMVALYRPGPLGSGMVEDFIDRKHGIKKVEYPHPLLKPVLEETYGVMVYQEQVMQVASVLAGFTLGQADQLRRIMGKKKAYLLPPERERFIKGCKECNNIDAKTAGSIFDLMEYFSGYGFNKSHSAAYGIVTYETAWLRCHYPAEYMAAIMTSFMTNAEKVTEYLEECKRMGLEILPPDINESKADFTVINGKIRFGMAAIKGIGRDIINHIIEERQKNGPFKSLDDLNRRYPLNKRVLEGMIKGGALDCFGAKRSQLLEVYEQSLELGRKYAQETASDQLSLFDFGMEEQKTVDVELPNIPEFPLLELLAYEKESIGFFISGHPLDEFTDIVDKISTHSVHQLAKTANGTKIRVVGLISQNKPRLTKKGESMSIFNLEDKMATVRCLAFPKSYSECRDIIIDGKVVLVEGRLKVDDDESIAIIVDTIHDLENTDLLTAPKDQEMPVETYSSENNNGFYRKSKKREPEKSKGKLYVRVKNSDVLPELRNFAMEYPGSLDLIPFYMDTKRYHQRLGIKIGVEAVDALENIYGKSNVVVRLIKETV